MIAASTLLFLSVGFILYSTIADGYRQRHYDSREG